MKREKVKIKKKKLRRKIDKKDVEMCIKMIYNPKFDSYERVKD